MKSIVIVIDRAAMPRVMSRTHRSDDEAKLWGRAVAFSIWTRTMNTAICVIDPDGECRVVSLPVDQILPKRSAA